MQKQALLTRPSSVGLVIRYKYIYSMHSVYVLHYHIYNIIFYSLGTAVMSGWLPVYDTMHGVRGEVNMIVKVDLFSDFNKFRQSSCGVQFFFSKFSHEFICSNFAQQWLVEK